MANEVSLKKISKKFISEIKEIQNFLDQSILHNNKIHIVYCYDYAVIKVFKEFEEFLLKIIIGIINQNAYYIASNNGLKGKKSIKKKDAKVSFLGNSYFSFKGNQGL